MMHPLLKKIVSPVAQITARYYLSRTRWYSFGALRIKVNPGVFHPGLFFSTKALVNYLATQPLNGARVLELGAGTGLIAIYCFGRGASVTASDISDASVENIRENSHLTNASIKIIKSDLFDAMDPSAFDWIIINPPFYPRQPLNDAQRAWYCGSEFDYFQNLFSQLAERRKNSSRIIMVLSEDCDLEKIEAIAAKHLFASTRVGETHNPWENLYILEWRN